MDHHPTSPRIGRRSAPRFVAVFAALATLFTVTATAALADSAVDTLVEIDANNGDMNSGANEWSGATYNADRNVLLTIDDENRAYEFDLNNNGTIDDETPVRQITLNISDSDWEGIAWIDDERYAVLSEGSGTAYVVDIPLGASSINDSNVVSEVFAGGPDGNTGSEGIDVDDDGNFIITDEMPASISKYSPAGALLGQVMLPQLGDATGVVVAEDDSYLVTSHESTRAIHIEVDWTAETATEIGIINLRYFSQLEGVALNGNSDVYFFGELKGGQTYSHQAGTVVTYAAWHFMDVDCSGESDVIDALKISRIEVGLESPNPECGSGDSDADGVLTIIDALLITQCDVGVPNIACPNI